MKHVSITRWNDKYIITLMEDGHTIETLEVDSISITF